MCCSNNIYDILSHDSFNILSISFFISYQIFDIYIKNSICNEKFCIKNKTFPYVLSIQRLIHPPK